MNNEEIKLIFETSVNQWVSSGNRVLLVVPDTTRTAPIANLLGMLYPALHKAGAEVTILIALGTHPPLSSDVLAKHLGLNELAACGYPAPLVLNHEWNNPETLLTIGELSVDEIRKLTSGLMAERVTLRVNKAIAKADLMVVLNPVFPHEMVGFSGGSKYLFPGISSSDMIDILHWLGALCTSGKIIGCIDTPGRRVLNAAAEKMPLPIYGLSFVYYKDEVVTMEAGTLNDAWARAANVSSKVHVIYKKKKFRSVLACCPTMYPDLWTGGKCMYKCEPVVEDGGELLIYAPHVKCFSEVHEKTIQSLGYHLRDYFLTHTDRYENSSRAVMAYCAIIKGDGEYRNGVEYPRIKVTFATGISQKNCEAVGIGYADPSKIKPELWMNREHEGVLYVEKAGEMLFRIENNILNT